MPLFNKLVFVYFYLEGGGGGHMLIVSKGSTFHIFHTPVKHLKRDKTALLLVMLILDNVGLTYIRGVIVPLLDNKWKCTKYLMSVIY